MNIKYFLFIVISIFFLSASFAELREEEANYHGYEHPARIATTSAPIVTRGMFSKSKAPNARIEFLASESDRGLPVDPLADLMKSLNSENNPYSGGFPSHFKSNRCFIIKANANEIKSGDIFTVDRAQVKFRKSSTNNDVLAASFSASSANQQIEIICHDLEVENPPPYHLITLGYIESLSAGIFRFR